MPISTTIKTIYHCDIERAFKTPILSDVTKVHTGSFITPPVTSTEEDESWGKPGGSRKIMMGKTWNFKGGYSSIDVVIDRTENEYWKIEISDLQNKALGLQKFVGEWSTKFIEPEKTEITYTYTIHFKYAILYPLQWLFVKLFWRKYMKQVLRNIEKMAKNKEPYLGNYVNG